MIIFQNIVNYLQNSYNLFLYHNQYLELILIIHNYNKNNNTLTYHHYNIYHNYFYFHLFQQHNYMEMIH